MIKLYECEFCGLKSTKKKDMKKHEKICSSTKKCANCRHLNIFFDTFYCQLKEETGVDDYVREPTQETCEDWSK